MSFGAMSLGTMKFEVALTGLVSIALYALATGFQTGRFTPSAFAQAALLGHMGAGLALVPLLALTVAWHPVRGADVPFLRRWTGRLLGLGALGTGGWAVWAGLRLPYEGALSARPELAHAHRCWASLFTATLGVHLLLSWSARNRLASRRNLAPLRAGALGVAACAIATAGLAAIVPRPPLLKPIPGGYRPIGVEPKTAFTPGREQVSHGQLIPVAALSGSHSCGTSGCHAQITEEWRGSAHRHAAHNDHYRAQVRLRIQDVPVKPHAGARFCSGCHEPIAVLAGEVDPGGRGIDFSENVDEGISCLACHRMTGIKDIAGNASYVIAPPRLYAGQTAGGAAGWLGRAMLRARPAAHQADLMRPLMRDSESCVPCHRLTVGPGINPNGFFIVQETYDEWRHTEYATSLDPAARRRCQDCHMPRVPSTDPAAKDGKHRSHRFVGANTMRPFLEGDAAQLAATQEFLRSGVVKLKLSAEPGRIVASISNEGVGHRFPTGTVDMHEVWVELVVHDADGRAVLESGLVDPRTHYVDPQSTQYRSVPLGKDGAWLYRRDMWKLASFQILPEHGERLEPGQFGYDTVGARRDFFNLTARRFMRTVWPGTSEEETFALPAARYPLQVTARLRHRKSNQKFTDWVFDPRPLPVGSGYDEGKHKPGVELPITDLATAQLTIPSAPK